MRYTHYVMYRGQAIAYGEGRAGTLDPTEGIPEPARGSIREEVLQHLARAEYNRAARANAMRYRSARDSGGDLVPSDPVGSEEREQPTPLTWDRVVARINAGPAVGE